VSLHQGLLRAPPKNGGMCRVTYSPLLPGALALARPAARRRGSPRALGHSHSLRDGRHSGPHAAREVVTQRNG